MLDKRGTPRAHVLRRAGSCTATDYTIDCVVLDVSPGGARLRVREWLVLPDDFELRIENGPVHEAGVPLPRHPDDRGPVRRAGAPPGGQGQRAGGRQDAAGRDRDRVGQVGALGPGRPATTCQPTNTARAPARQDGRQQERGEPGEPNQSTPAAISFTSPPPRSPSERPGGEHEDSDSSDVEPEAPPAPPPAASASPRRARPSSASAARACSGCAGAAGR